MAWNYLLPRRPRTPWLLPPSLTLLKGKNQWAPIRFSFRLNALSDGNWERQSDGETQSRGVKTQRERTETQKKRVRDPERGTETPRERDPDRDGG